MGKRVVLLADVSDYEFRSALETHLEPRVCAGIIEVWHDGKVLAGANLQETLFEQIDTADVVVPLVSAQFLAGETHIDNVNRAREHRRPIVAVHIRHCHWDYSVFEFLERVPSDVPVDQWSSRDAAWREVVAWIDEALGDRTHEERLYRDAIVKQCREIRVRLPGVRVRELALEDVYVDLHIRPFVDRPGNAMDSEERRLRSGLDGFDPSDEQEGATGVERRLRTEARTAATLDTIDRWHRLDAHRYEQARRPAEPSPSTRSILERVAHGPRPLVILGDPGSGKSTILRLMALRLAKGGHLDQQAPSPELGWLPIFAPLAAYDGENIEDFLAKQLRNGDANHRQLLHRALLAGRAFVLLDGLDEAGDEARRNEIARRIADFTREWQARGNRFVVTSRVIGYREASLPEEFEQTIIVDFRTTDIVRFLVRWYTALEQRSASQDEPIAERAVARKDAFMFELARSPWIQELARNPLMLGTLASLHQVHDALPERRVEIYRDLTRMTLEVWPQERSNIPEAATGRDFEIDELREHARALAWWLQQREIGALATRDQLISTLERIALEMEASEPARPTLRERANARQKARGLFDAMCRTEGLIIERSPNKYGFVHRALQEFFVAEALADMPPDDRWLAIRPHLHHAAWRDVILLTSGWLSLLESAGADELTCRVLSAESPYEDVLRRDLLLAAAILAEDVAASPKVQQTVFARLDEATKGTIGVLRHDALQGVAGLAKIGHADAIDVLYRLAENAAASIQTAQTQSLYIALRTAIRSPRCERLQELIERQIRESVVRVDLFSIMGWAPSEVLDDLARTDRRWRDLLLALFGAPTAWQLRSLLEPLISEDAQVRQAFIQRAEVPSSEQPIVSTLARLVPEHPEVRPLLESRWSLKSNDGHVGAIRSAILPAIARWAAREPRWLQELLSCLDSAEPNMRGTALVNMAAIGARNSIVESTILHHVDSDHSDVASNAVSALGVIAKSSPGVTPRLVKLLEHPRSRIRHPAVDALCNLIDAREARMALEGLLDDHDDDVRRKATAALAKLPRMSSPLRHRLAHQLDDIMTCTKAERIATVAPMIRHESTMASAIECYLDDVDPTARAAATSALAPLGPDDPRIMNRITRMTEDPEISVRVAAIRATGAAAASNADARQRLIRIATGAADPEADAAIRALAPALSDRETRAALLDICREAASGRKATCARLLQPLIASHVDVRNFFSELARTFTGDLTDPDVLTTASMLDGSLGYDAEILAGVRARMGRITQSVAELVQLSRTAESDREAFSRYLTLERTVVGGLLSMVAKHARDLGAFSLLAAIHKHPFYLIQHCALRGLSQWMDEREDVRSYIFDVAASSDMSVSFVVTEILAKRLLKDAEATEVLISMAQQNRLGDRRSFFVAEALVPHAASSAAIEDFFRRVLRDSSASFEKRFLAASALASVAQKDPELALELLPWLGARSLPNGEDGRKFRRRLADGLSMCIHLGSTLRAELERMLDSMAWQERQGAAWTLLAMRADGRTAPEGKLRGLLDDARAEESWSDRLEAAKLVLNHRDDALSQRAIEVARSALSYEKMAWCEPLGERVRQQAAEILSQLDPMYQDDTLITLLCEALQREPAPEVRDRLFLALRSAVAAPRLQ